MLIVTMCNFTGETDEHLRDYGESVRKIFNLPVTGNA